MDKLFRYLTIHSREQIVIFLMLFKRFPKWQKPPKFVLLKIIENFDVVFKYNLTTIVKYENLNTFLKASQFFKNDGELSRPSWT